MSAEPQVPQEDQAELKRFRELIKNQYKAMDVQLPDERFLRPNRDHHHYDIHITEETGMTIINTFHFKTEAGIRAAIDHTKALLPEPIDEREDIETAAQDAPAAGSAVEGSQADLEPHTPPGAA